MTDATSLGISVPALIFPAISLLFISYVHEITLSIDAIEVEFERANVRDRVPGA